MRVTGFVVCVEYDDLLAITLHRNMRHMRQCIVVTSPNDVKTQELASCVAGVKVHVTDAFYRGGAKFNKGLALEEAFELSGRQGWCLIWDADTLMQEKTIWPENLQQDVLYGARRLLLDDPSRWSPEFNWSHARPTQDRPGTGYFQLFHASSPTIAKLPWYDCTFTHAGGGDGYFTARWERKEWLPFKVLHLGPRDANWMGRATAKLDGSKHENAEARRAEMQHYLQNAPWRGKSPTLFEEHVQVEGHTPTGYVTGSGKVTPQ